MNGGPEGSGDGASPGLVEIDLAFETMRQLQDQLAPTLSNDGLFLPSDSPVSPDTVVRFRVSLPENFVLIEGTGVVVWCRHPGDDAGPPGMAIRYASLSREAQETIDAIIDAHLASGGDLFSLEPEREGADGIPTDALGHEVRPSSELTTEAREATARQLEQARLTIREGAGEVSPEIGEPAKEPISTLEEQYLSSVEEQVEEAVASIGVSETPEGVEPSPDLEEPPEFEAEQPAVEIIDVEAIEAELVDAESPPTARPPAGLEAAAEIEPTERLPSQDRPSGDEDAQPDAIESLIPAFLERWKQEVRTVPESDAGPGDTPEAPQEASPVPGEESAAVLDADVPLTVPPEVGEAPPEALPVSVDETPRLFDADLPPSSDAELGDQPPGPVDEPSESAVLEAEPVMEPPHQFEVSVVESGEEPDETPVHRPTPGEAEVTLAPSEVRPPSGGRRWLWLVPLILAPIAAVAAYFGWNWYQGRPAAESQPTELISAPVETAEAPVQPPAAPMEEGRPETGVETAADAAAEPAPEPEPVAVEMVSEPAEPVSVVESITWDSGAGITEVVIQGNGFFDADLVSVFPMREPARILVRLRKITEKYQQYEVPVGTPEVDRIRVGHHPELAPPALYVVLDLADPLVGVADLEVHGDTVRVSVAVQ